MHALSYINVMIKIKKEANSSRDSLRERGRERDQSCKSHWTMIRWDTLAQ